MDELHILIWSGVISAVVGSITGALASSGMNYWVGEVTARKRQREADDLRRQQDEHIRADAEALAARRIAQVQSEIHQDVELLRSYLATLSQQRASPQGASSQEGDMRERAYFVREPLPLWSSTAWQEQKSHLLTSLDPSQHQAIQNFYDKLSRIREYQQRIAEKARTHLIDDFTGWTREPRQPGVEFETMSFYRDSVQFLDATTPRWNEVKDIMTELLAGDGLL